MRTVTIAATCLALTLGIGAAHSQTSSPGGAPATGPAAGVSPNRATGNSPDARSTPFQRGLPSNPGLSSEAGGRPLRQDRLDGTNLRNRIRRPERLSRLRRGNRMEAGESTDHFPPSRVLPLRPGSPADARRARNRPLGLEAEGSPSASQRRAAQRTGADYSQRECEQIYDSGTGMTRQQWSASCARVGQRMDQLREIGRQQIRRPSPTSPSGIGVFGPMQNR